MAKKGRIKVAEMDLERFVEAPRGDEKIKEVRKMIDSFGIVYTAMCYEHGGMIDYGTLFRLGDTNFRWIGGNDQSGRWLR